MGDIAFPDTPYCNGEPAASLSVNGQIYSTDNPPISYSVTGTTATISDAGGVIASVELSGQLIADVTQPASPDTDYCSGKPKAVLTWNSGIQVQTTDTPISYSVINPGTGIRVDWGGGDVDILTGTTWEKTPPPWGRLGYWVTDYVAWNGTTDVFSIEGYEFENAQWTGYSSAGGCPYDSSIVGIDSGRDIYDGLTCTAGAGGIPPLSSISVYWSLSLVGDDLSDAGRSGPLPNNKYRVETDTGDFSERDTTTSPVVTLLNENYQILVFDSSGDVTNYQGPAEPTGFNVTCYDYDYSVDASYVCDGACPSGTLWQCTCEATNTRSCYGYDPDNPDVFKPLFVTTIT